MSIRFSFVPGEVIAPGTPIRIYSTGSIDHGSAKRSIRLISARAIVKSTVSTHDTMVQVSTDGLPSNVYTFRIGPLLDCDGARINELPFSTKIILRSMKAQISSDYLVQHIIHLAVGETSSTRLRPGEAVPVGAQYVEAVRLMHRHTGKLYRRYFNVRGEEFDGVRLLGAARQRRETKFGRLHEGLWKKLHEAGDDDLHEVIIWPKAEDDDNSSRQRGKSGPGIGEQATPHSIAVLQRSRMVIANLVRGLGAHCHDLDAIPRIRTKLTSRQIHQLARCGSVAKIFDGDDTYVTLGRASLRTSLALSRANRVLDQGIITGKGIKVAVWEAGPTNTEGLVFAGRYTDHPEPSDHSRLVSAVIKTADNPNEPRGYAPDCELYSANAFEDGALMWAISQGCTVINHSAFKTIAEDTGEQSELDVVQDWLTMHPPYPTIVTAAGNFGRATDSNVKYVTCKSYNSISVGAHASSFRNDISEKRIPDWSNYRNPTSPHADRELPIIAGPGADISALGLTMSGTSFAAPAVAGAVALIQSVNPALLQHNPTACRAIILASAGRNASNSLWTADITAHIDARDGAGAMDVDAAIKIAQRHSPSPTTSLLPRWPRGWHHTVYASADSSVPTKSVTVFKTRIHIPTPLELGTTSDLAATNLNLRAVVTWNSKVQFMARPPGSVGPGGGTGLSFLPVNLDLRLLDARSGLLAAFAATFDNNYEVLDFAPVVAWDYDLEVVEDTTHVGLVGERVGVAVAWCLFYDGEAV